MISNVAGDRLFKQIGERLETAYTKIHKSGNYNDGEYCRSAEKKLKHITGRKHAKMLTSATSALMVALISWDMRNKNVACANYSYIASANQAALLNQIELFDVDDKGLMSLEQTFKHDLVIPVSLYGNTIDYDKLNISNNTKVIVDAAQSLGSKYKGKPDGSFGDASIFSFARNKPIPTAGTHGALVWDDDAMTEKIKAVSNNGKLGRESKVQSYGINAVPMELQAAQIDIGLDHMGEWQLKRRLVHEHYAEQFKNLPITVIEPNDYCESNYHKFVILSDQRNNLKKYLVDHNIQAIEHYKDNFADFFGNAKKFPYTEIFCNNVLTLPNHPWMFDSEVETVADKVKEFFK
jgi:dTDP-4-amino-4,6-dideoxygalactose transaminase